MHPHHLLPRDGEESERVVLAEVLLGEEREFGQIRERPQVIGMHSPCSEAAPVVRDIPVGMTHGPPQPVELQRTDLIYAGSLR